MAYQERTDRYALYDMSQNRRARRQKLQAVPACALISSDSVKYLVHDPVRTKFPPEASLLAKYAALRDTHWAMVQRLFGQVGERDSAVELPDGHAHEDIFFDRAWFKRRVQEEARRLDVETGQLYRLFWRCVRHGGDRRAMTPSYHECGAKGKPKSLLQHAEKPGRKAAGYFLDPDHYRPENRMTAFWRGRIVALIVSIAARSPESARARFSILRELVREFNADYVAVPGSMREVTRAQIGARRIPEPHTIARHMRAILTELWPELGGLLPEWRPPPTGRATDIGHPLEVIADLDGTLFPYVEIVVPNSNRTAFFSIGSPRLILAIVRGSDYPLGWYVAIGPENRMAYTYCLVCMFCDKSQRFAQLGFTTAPQWLRSGNVDRAVVDWGPGAAKEQQVWTLESLHVNLTKTPAYYAPGKGGVEGANARVKDGFIGKLALTKELERCVKPVIERRAAAGPKYSNVKRRGRGRPAKAVIYMELRDFERLVVEVLNDLAGAKRTAPRAETLDRFVAGELPSRYEAFCDQQERRRGDQNYAHTEDEIRDAIFKRRLKSKRLRGGRFCLARQMEYGVDPHDPVLTPPLRALHDYECRMGGMGQPVYVEVCADCWGNAALWRHPDDGRWLRIPPTSESIHRCGKDTDLVEIEQQRLEWLDRAHKNNVKDAKHKRKPTGAQGHDAAKEIAKIQKSAGLIASRSRQDAGARRQAIAAQKSREALVDAKAAGVEPQTAPPKSSLPAGFRPQHGLFGGVGTVVDLEALRAAKRQASNK
ncbi:hypothetical protein [Cupriavidus consociatus]|uniref:hypothetical protein n=1 Tax=Cupriavidus consociatus TaxID=2821357 RepID=UPI001AE650E8|nr:MULTISPECIES: hypothetical protein [unclassified Cupriavidus]MBP0621202.1 hypothetical protein [Cupriavidus sp. LEh25]MDK2657873.1 hypothetical protein [Cupriavidus sp. LEh21]